MRNVLKFKNLGPSPALARDAQALARPVSDSLSELTARVRPFSQNSLYYCFSY